MFTMFHTRSISIYQLLSFLRTCSCYYKFLVVATILWAKRHHIHQTGNNKTDLSAKYRSVAYSTPSTFPIVFSISVLWLLLFCDYY